MKLKAMFETDRDSVWFQILVLNIWKNPNQENQNVLSISQVTNNIKH